MLAQAAIKSGFIPIVIDLYADLDTRFCAEEVIKVDSLAVCTISSIVQNLKQRFSIKTAVYGSGLEKFPESVFFCIKNLSWPVTREKYFKKFKIKSIFLAY